MAYTQMTPELFREKLQMILEQANAKGGRIRRDEVGAFFSGEELSEEQLGLVFDFLLSKKIVVEGYERQDEQMADAGEDAPLWSEEEQRWLEIYEEDLAAVRPEQPGELEQLLIAAAGGDPAAKRRLTELFLPEVSAAAKRLYHPGVLLSDVIQEASLELVLFVEQLSGRTLADAAKVREELHAGIRRSVQALLEEQKDVHTRDRKMVSKVQDFKDAVTELKEDLGRKVYLDEIADYLHISEEEAADILKLAGEDVPEEEG